VTVLELDRAAAQAASTSQVEHRPWPLPRRPWTMGQTWEDLLFVHWPVAEAELRRHVPVSLELDLHDGEAWLGVTPFRVTAWRLRGLPPLPLLSSFLELNVRTYVRRDDRPGIWFFSLDATSPLAVEGARLTYKLPYFRARITSAERDGAIAFDCRRVGELDTRFSARYRPAGDPFTPEPGSLEHFLTERYRLYTTDDRNRLRHADIHHARWRLRPAEAELEAMTMQPEDVVIPTRSPLVHLAGRQDVVLWPLM
jgi:uncharacterized protein YqjF (DUF2071 family)